MRCAHASSRLSSSCGHSRLHSFSDGDGAGWAEQASQPRGDATGCSAELAPGPVRASTLGSVDRPAVRERNGLTAVGLSKVVEDPQGWVDECGAVFYTEPVHGPGRGGDA